MLLLTHNGIKGVNMDNLIGINKEIDHLGRITIPKDLRSLYNLNEQVELVATIKGLLIRNPRYVLVEKNEEID